MVLLTSPAPNHGIDRLMMRFILTGILVLMAAVVGWS